MNLQNHHSNVTPAEYFGKVWDILVEAAELSSQSHTREMFIDYHLRGITEYRFIGGLGFGGKFYSQGKPRVGCYPEDRTMMRDLMVDTVNELLQDLGPIPKLAQ